MPYSIIKDLSINNENNPNKHRFSGKAFPCDNDRRKDFTIFTILLNNYKVVPVFRAYKINDVNLTNKDKYYSNSSKIYIPIIVIIVIVLLVTVIVVRFKLKKKPTKGNGLKGSNQKINISDNAESLYHKTARKSGELNF